MTKLIFVGLRRVAQVVIRDATRAALMPRHQLGVPFARVSLRAGGLQGFDCGRGGGIGLTGGDERRRWACHEIRPGIFGVYRPL